MNQALRDQIWAMARQAGAEFYEGFAGSPDMIHFHEPEFERFASAIIQLIEAEAVAAHDRGYDAGHFAAENQSAFEARNQE